MERIIYVIPYLSVLEQAANGIREALGISADDPSFLEHHSNLIPPDDEEKAKGIKLLTDRWDVPIVITTAVQFLESVFSEKASKLRKFHNMTNAVLIFDEVQFLPVKCINLFNDAANFLSMFGKSTVLLCTATQPLLDNVEHRIRLSPKPNLAANMRNDFSALNRTRIINNCIKEKYTSEVLADFVLEKQRRNGNCLVILNTKKNVIDLFKAIKVCVADNVRRFKNAGFRRLNFVGFRRKEKPSLVLPLLKQCVGNMLLLPHKFLTLLKPIALALDVNNSAVMQYPVKNS